MIKRGIGEKGQVVIPKDIRKHLGLDVGINITFEVEDDKIILRKEHWWCMPTFFSIGRY